MLFLVSVARQLVNATQDLFLGFGAQIVVGARITGEWAQRALQQRLGVRVIIGDEGWLGVRVIIGDEGWLGSLSLRGVRNEFATHGCVRDELDAAGRARRR